MRWTKGLCAAVALGFLTMASPAPAEEALQGADLLAENCSGCHAPDTRGELSRIGGQRKTPEGWLMTIVRMRQQHGLDIDIQTQSELVRYLSEVRGLAPSETAGYRYALEKAPAAQEEFDTEFAELCARCHTGARVVLQRRTLAEWALQNDLHIKQWPSIELQSKGRDREWYNLAKTVMTPKLAALYPLETEAWTDWSQKEKPSPEGDWVFKTRLPELGEAFGRLTVSGGTQPFKVSGSLKTPGGKNFEISGRMNFYTGYEWRGSVKIGSVAYRQIFALSEDGQRLEGRHFQRNDDHLGGHVLGARVGEAPVVLGLIPSAIAAGTADTVQIVGANLGTVEMGEGAKISRQRDNHYGAALQLAADSELSGPVTASVGGAETTLMVYDRIDRIAVEPAFAIARVGGDGGSTPPISAHFTAIGYLAGADGEPGTEDDVRIGEVPASWSVAPHDEIAEAFNDVAFAGVMNPDTGIFAPAAAGPNPERPFSTNNAGHLNVIAKAGEGLEADAQLVVTVQRWVDSPIR